MYLKSLLSVVFISLILMNVYSRALKHIDMNDVKQKHHQKLVEKKSKEEEKDKLMEELRYKNSPLYSNWRHEISEGMTSDGVFQTTLPATGDQTLGTGTDLSYGPNTDLDPELYYGVGNGDDYDTRYYDTVVFDVTAGVGPLEVLMDGITVYTSSGGSGTVTITIPPNLRRKNMNITWSTAIPYETTGYGNWRISNIRFQRKTPMNVFVPLDSPEATSFIRTDPGFAGLSEAEKKQKLKEMLKASDEYVEKIFGEAFPGSGAVPPGESGDTPGVETQDIDYGEDLTPLSDNPYGTEVGQVAGGGMSPVNAVNMLTDMINDKMGGNQVNVTVGGQRFSGPATNVRQQIRTSFPGGV